MHAFLLLAVLTSSDTISGRVTDEAGRPLALVSVEIAELGRQATTAADGSFLFDLGPGRYTVIVRRAGFASVSRNITVTGRTTLNLKLAQSEFALEPITVTATRQPLAADLSPLPATALGGDELRRAPSVSLSHVVEALPGVRAITTGAQIGKPVIRGFSGPRVLVLENGSRLEDYSWSDEDGPSVETAFVRRIELIRGPASVLYGSDALGGVINVIPEQLPDASGGPAFIRTGFTLSGATNNIEAGAGAQVEGARGIMGWRVAAVGRGAGNLHTPVGELDNTGFGSFNGNATAGWRWPSGSALAVRLVHYGGEFKLLEANAPPGEQGGPERKLGDERIQITGQRPFGDVRLEVKGQLQRHSLIELADDSTGTESEAFNLLLQTASLDLLAHYRGATFGATAIGQTNDAAGRVAIVPDARMGSGAAFVFDQWTLGDGRWTLLTGARLDARRLSVDRHDSLGVVAQDRSSHAWSANAGVVFAPVQRLAVSLNVGRAWRASTLFELFANGPHIGEARYERGDSTLQPEASRGIDVGVRWSGRRARLELAAYHNRMSNYIYITPTAVFINSLRLYQYGQAQAELLGGEAVLETEVRAGVIARGRVEAVRGTNLTSREPLPLLPPLRAAFGLGWRNNLTLDVDTYARPDRPNPLDIPTPGYALVHLGGGTDLRLFGRAVRLDISLRNVLNQRYRSFLSRYKEFAFDPGRNLIVRLSSGYLD